MITGLRGRCAAFSGVAVSVVVALLLVAGEAGAASRIYWVNGRSNTISFAALDGTESGTLDTGGVVVSDPNGLSIDTVSQTVYWANNAGHRIAFASLLGQGGDFLETGELESEQLFGLAVDPAAERVYWANRDPADLHFRIAVGFTDGSFAAPLTEIGDAVMKDPSGVAVDPRGGRIYWSNTFGTAPVSYANLNGSGGGSLNPLGATVDLPTGLAVDIAGGRAYWANALANRISYANLDGSGGGDLPTGGATVNFPWGVALDPVARRIYWVSAVGNRVSYANLDGTGGGDLPTGSVTPKEPRFPVLFLSPRPAAAPRVRGDRGAGSILTCSGGTWAPDLPEAQLFEAPHSFEYQWTREGLDLPGETASSVAARVPGAYACRVTARNAVGSAVQASPPFEVTRVAFGKSTGVTLGPASPRVSRAGRLVVRVRNANPFEVRGRLGAVLGARRVRARSFTVGPHVRALVGLPLPPAARRGHVTRVALTATVTDLAGGRRVVRKTVTARPLR